MKARKEEITALASQSVQKDGLRSVSFRQLADEIGIKSSSVHYHFPTKPDLAEALISDYTERFTLQLQEIKHDSKSLHEQLDGLVGIFESVLQDKNLCLCGMLAAELTSLDDNARLALKKFFLLTEDWVVQALEHYQPTLRVQLSHEELAQIVVSGLEGAMLLDRAEEDGNRLQAFRVLVRALIN